MARRARHRGRCHLCQRAKVIQVLASGAGPRRLPSAWAGQSLRTDRPGSPVGLRHAATAVTLRTTARTGTTIVRCTEQLCGKTTQFPLSPCPWLSLHDFFYLAARRLNGGGGPPLHPTDATGPVRRDGNASGPSRHM